MLIRPTQTTWPITAHYQQPGHESDQSRPRNNQPGHESDQSLPTVNQPGHKSDQSLPWINQPGPKSVQSQPWNNHPGHKSVKSRVTITAWSQIRPITALDQSAQLTTTTRLPLPVWWLLYLSLCLCGCLFVCLSFLLYLFVLCLPTCLPACLSVKPGLSVFLSLCPDDKVFH